MKKITFALLFFLAITAHAQVTGTRTVRLMGSRFDITMVARDSLFAEKYIDTVIAEVTRIENLISDWKSDSQITEVNNNAGIRPVKVAPEVFELTKRGLHLSEMTNGAFDISFAAMDRIWKFDGSMKEMPSPETIKNSVRNVGYRNVILDEKNSTIFLKQKGMKIGFGSIGKGYAADYCRDLMMSKGVPAGIVNASGDISAWGKQPEGGEWTVGITNPMKDDTVFAVIPLLQSAVVTSGSYEKYVMFNGVRYSHILNPVTGYPATGVCSVTVFGPDAELANGFSTSIMVMGKDKGLELIKAYPAYQCVIIADDGTVFLSPNLNPDKFKL
jgi:thiamine biosynthesis lipoprotein